LKQKLKRVTKEHQYWTYALNEAIKGFRDADVASLLLQYFK